MKSFGSAYIVRTAVAFALTGAMLQPGFTQPLPSRPKKLIEDGWDRPNTSFIRKNLAVMEKSPFDGTIIWIWGWGPDKKRYTMGDAFQPGDWKCEWFQNNVDDLNACHFTRLTDNFVRINAEPGNVDWFDDAGWHDIENHFRIAAWIAHEGHQKGISFDCEGYVKPFFAFDYGAQPDRGKHSFDEYYEKARQRGREVMQALADIYPDMTLFCCRMDSVNPDIAGHADARQLLAAEKYGLLTPFINGWLDVAPSTMKFVDGCEDTFVVNSRADYLRYEDIVKNQSLDLVPPEDRAKYKAQVEDSFGFYEDAYSNPPSAAPNYMPAPETGTRAEQIGAAVATALRISDEYVWLDGEHSRWWPRFDQYDKKHPWTETLPGIADALGFAAHPAEMARQRVDEMSAAGTLRDLMRNGDFSVGPAADTTLANAARGWKTDGVPAQWTTWQSSDSKGTFAWDPTGGTAGSGAARASNILNGCFNQVEPVEPGQYYAISALTRHQGSGQASIRVRWMNAADKWISPELDSSINVGDTPQGNHGDWQELFGAAHVPPGASKLLVLLCVNDQASADDVAWFDDVHLYLMP